MKMMTNFEGYDYIRHPLAVLTAFSEQQKKKKCDEGDPVTSSGPTSAVGNVNKNTRSKNTRSKNTRSKNTRSKNTLSKDPTVSESPAGHGQASANCGKTENFPSDITAELEISNQGLKDSNTEPGEDSQEHWPDQLASGSVCSTSSTLMNYASRALNINGLDNNRTTLLDWYLEETALEDVGQSFDATSQGTALNPVSNTILAPIQSEPAMCLTSATTYIGNQTLTMEDAYTDPSSTLMIDHFRNRLALLLDPLGHINADDFNHYAELLSYAYRPLKDAIWAISNAHLFRLGKIDYDQRLMQNTVNHISAQLRDEIENLELALAAVVLLLHFVVRLLS